MLIIFGAVTLVSCQSHQHWREEMRLAHADANAREWMFELNQSEAQYEAHTKSYGGPQDFAMPPAPTGYSASVRLADATAYTATLQPTDKNWDGFYTDQSMIIRRCPGSKEPIVWCPAIIDPMLIAPNRVLSR